MLKTALFLLVVFLSNIIQCVTGFAGTVLAMPVSIMLVGYETAKPILNVLGIAASVGVVALNYKSVNKKEFLKITGIMLLGIFADTFITADFSRYAHTLYLILGFLVIAIAVANSIKFFSKKETKDAPEWLSLILLVLSGLVHGIFDCGGPLLVTYASAKLKDSHEFRSTLSAVWIVLNSVILFSDVRAGYFVGQTLSLTFVCLAVLVFALIFGHIISKKMSRNAFLILTYVLMIISGISLILE